MNFIIQLFTITQMSQTLPSRFLLRRYNTKESACLHCLVSYSPDNHLFDLVERIHVGVANLTKIPKPTYGSWNSFDSQELQTGLGLTVEVWYEGYGAEYQGVFVPCFNMTKACQTLPVGFETLLTPTYKRYWFLVSDTPLKQIPIVLDTRAHLEEQLRMNPGDCPILMTPLSLDDLCQTPCRHLMTYTALLQWMERRKECPVCRGNIVEATLVSS